MLASLPQFKRHLDIPTGDTSDDDELSLMLDAAIEVVSNLIGWTSTGDVDDDLPVYDGTVLLGDRPVGPVVVTQDGEPVAGFTVNAAARLLTGVPVLGRVQVSYEGSSGSSVPATVTLATLIIGEHLWVTQRGNGPGSLDLQDDAVNPQVFGLGYAVPSRARELLAPHVRSGQVA